MRQIETDESWHVAKAAAFRREEAMDRFGQIKSALTVREMTRWNRIVRLILCLLTARCTGLPCQDAGLIGPVVRLWV